MSPSRQSRHRSGGTAVEFAIVAPLLFLFIFGLVEFGRMSMVLNTLNNAAIAGARHAVLDGATVDTTKDTVEEYLANSSVTVSREDILVAPDPTTLGVSDPITVSLSVTYDDVKWLPSPKFLASKVLEATSMMRRETAQ